MIHHIDLSLCPDTTTSGPSRGGETTWGEGTGVVKSRGPSTLGDEKLVLSTDLLNLRGKIPLHRFVRLPSDPPPSNLQWTSSATRVSEGHPPGLTPRHRIGPPPRPSEVQRTELGPNTRSDPSPGVRRVIPRTSCNENRYPPDSRRLTPHCPNTESVEWGTLLPKPHPGGSPVSGPPSTPYWVQSPRLPRP